LEIRLSSAYSIKTIYAKQITENDSEKTPALVVFGLNMRCFLELFNREEKYLLTNKWLSF